VGPAADELALALAAAGEYPRQVRRAALVRLSALLPAGGGTLDGRFHRRQPPGSIAVGSPVRPEDNDWPLAAVCGLQLGKTFTPARRRVWRGL